MAELKLRNCPFCGEKAEVRISLGRDIVSCTNCHAEMVGSYINIDSLIEEWNTRESPIVNRWIPCSERLPESEREVLVYVKGDFDNSIPFITTAYRNSEGDWQSDYDGEVIDSKITHWMPLPEPPKE